MLPALSVEAEEEETMSAKRVLMLMPLFVVWLPAPSSYAQKAGKAEGDYRAWQMFGGGPENIIGEHYRRRHRRWRDDHYDWLDSRIRAGHKISAQAFTTNSSRYRVSANIKAVRQTYQYNFAGPFAGIATTTVHHHGFASTQEVGNEPSPASSARRAGF